ncbi:hypothetical protein VTN77DRAFT_2457 [Rasamsonia byssochlamydoides]|uniref:uncharacterized protein n=1 Tax=Rasamsonia byssochlamydoides TaxID=89139 RepID=UPI0037423292
MLHYTTATPSSSHLQTPARSNSVSSSVNFNSSTIHDRSGSVNSISEGLAFINRWSQSTVSSWSSPQSGDQHRDDLSRRTSLGDGSLSPVRNIVDHPQTSQIKGNPNTSLRFSKKSSGQFAVRASTDLLETVTAELESIASVSPLRVTSDAHQATASSVFITSPVTTQYISAPSDSGSWRKEGHGLPTNSGRLDTEPDVPKPGVSSQTITEQSFRTTTMDDTSRIFFSEQASKAADDIVDASSPSPPRGRRQRGQSQKAMLSKALQKANTAVLLDNAANFEGAIEAYNDACDLLQLVMLRSSGGDDEKIKLQEIRNTYLVRIKELQRLDIPSQQYHEKALPERPLSDQSFSHDTFQPLEGEDEDTAAIETATTRRIVDNSFRVTEVTSSQLPARRQSLLPSPLEEGPRTMTSEMGFNRHRDRSLSDMTSPERRSDHSLNRAPVDGDDYILPLSPRRPYSPDFQSDSSHISPRTVHPPLYSVPNQRTYEPGNESTSWLDTIDESGASSPASAQSQSSMYLRRHSRRVSTGTEAEFDAALDAAVEAAYDEGLEPAMDASDEFFEDDVVSNARRNIEIAKQRVREAEREAQVVMARGREQRHIQDETLQGQTDGMDSDYIDEEAEEEERLLEEMTKGYVMDDFEFDLHSKSALPRQSDSSGFSGRTWGSSVASNTTTAGTSLSTLAEGVVLPSLDAKMQPPKRLPPPPRIPSSGPPAQPSQSRPLTPSSSFGTTTGAGVRARRLSGQNLKQLKIETNRIPSGSQAPTTEPPSIPLTSPPPPPPQDEPKTSLPIRSSSALNVTSRPSQPRISERKGSMDSLTGDSYGSGLAQVSTHDSEDWGRSNAPSPSRPIGKVPSAPGNLRKITSSSSLRGLRGRNMSISTPDISDSPNTPSIPTPTGATFTANGLPTGGLYLFDSNIHSPNTPGSPNSTAVNAPIPLEPCPESFLLRPFWLMRCLYQTIAHPRGGYLSTKLFVPRDVWRVKNVKIKAVEDKVSSCDLLTAALLKLAQVDTYDADAVLEEMQAFENILDQVQGTLAKKLGSEVGVQGSLSLFKSVSEDATVTTENSSLKTSNGTGKSYLSSWRKLRSKSSAATSSNAPLPSARENAKDNLTMNSLPMTATPSSRVAKRNVTQLQFTGPNANYMGALARLFDAAQVLDQIARQVEDPGLKHSSPTHVGLELSTRHAAEFFGFYVCRFALNDVGLLLDKFIKRGSEWVMM